MSSYRVAYNKLYLAQFVFLLTSTLAVLWGFSVAIEIKTHGNGSHLHVVTVLLGALLLVMAAFVIIKLITTKFGLEIGEDGVVSHVSGWAKVVFTWDNIVEAKIVLVENDAQAVKIVCKESTKYNRQSKTPRKPFFRITGDLIWCHMLKADAVTIVKEIEKRLG